MYDENNNIIYHESGNGFWAKREYDENNNIIYYENSYGVIADNRPKKKYTIKELEELTGIDNLEIVKEKI